MKKNDFINGKIAMIVMAVAAVIGLAAYAVYWWAAFSGKPAALIGERRRHRPSVVVRKVPTPTVPRLAPEPVETEAIQEKRPQSDPTPAAQIKVPEKNSHAPAAGSDTNGRLPRPDLPIDVAEKPVRVKTDPAKSLHVPMRYSVQVGAFLQQEYADQLLNELREAGYPAYVFEQPDAKKRFWHTVRIGDFAELPQATQVVHSFIAKEKRPAVVVYYESLRPAALPDSI